MDEQEQPEGKVPDVLPWRWYHIIPFVVIGLSLKVALKVTAHRLRQPIPTHSSAGDSRPGVLLPTFTGKPRRAATPGKPLPAPRPAEHAAVRDPERIRQILEVLVKTQLELTGANLTPDTRLGPGGLGADELDHVELIMSAEEAFDIEIPDAVAEQIRTVGDLTAAVIRAQKPLPSPRNSPSP